MTVTLEQIKQKQAELDALIRAFEEQEESPEFPNRGDTYYYITEEGYIEWECCNCDSFDEDVFANGNGFPTKEKAEFEREFRKVKYEMERCGGVFSDKINRDELYYLKRGEVVYIESTSLVYYVPSMWFPDYASALKALETIGDERLLEYWFRVEVQE